MEFQPGSVLRDDALDLALAQGRPVAVRIAAGDASMEPLLRGGDAVLAVALEREPRPGDLLLFRQRDYLVLHRYLGPARAPDGTPCLRTRGDGRTALDPPLDRKQVRARASAVRTGGSWRSLERGLAPIYSRLIAGHALLWSAAGVAARPLGLARAVAAVDSGLLRVLVPATFRWVHLRVVPPPLDGSAKTG